MKRESRARIVRALLFVLAAQWWAQAGCAMPASMHHQIQHPPMPMHCAAMDGSAHAPSEQTSACAHCHAPDVLSSIDAPLLAAPAITADEQPIAPSAMADKAPANFTVHDPPPRRLYLQTLRLRI